VAGTSSAPAPRRRQQHENDGCHGQRRHVPTPRGAAALALGVAVQGLFTATAGPLCEVEQARDHEQLQDRQPGGRAQVEELGGQQVDLGLHGGVPQPAEGEHHPERRRAEEEHHAGRGHDSGAERRQGDGADHLPRRGPERGRGLLAAPVEVLPERPDREDDHGEVEEHHRRDDRHRGAVEAQHTEGAGRGQQGPERDADHDGGHHERHQHERTQQTATREPQPVQHERDRQAHRDGHERRGARRPQREPQHPVHPLPAEHLDHAGRVEARVGEEPPGDHARHGYHEEDGEREKGKDRQGGDRCPGTRSVAQHRVIGW
jgi:hypothetical protein